MSSLCRLYFFYILATKFLSIPTEILRNIFITVHFNIDLAKSEAFPDCFDRCGCWLFVMQVLVQRPYSWGLHPVLSLDILSAMSHFNKAWKSWFVRWLLIQGKTTINVSVQQHFSDIGFAPRFLAKFSSMCPWFNTRIASLISKFKSRHCNTITLYLTFITSSCS